MAWNLVKRSTSRKAMRPTILMLGFACSYCWISSFSRLLAGGCSWRRKVNVVCRCAAVERLRPATGAERESCRSGGLQQPTPG